MLHRKYAANMIPFTIHSNFPGAHPSQLIRYTKSEKPGGGEVSSESSAASTSHALKPLCRQSMGKHYRRHQSASTIVQIA